MKYAADCSNEGMHPNKLLVTNFMLISLLVINVYK